MLVLAHICLRVFVLISTNVLFDDVLPVVLQVMLPDTMPAQFQSTYTPIAAAGTDTQVKHMARLLATQLTMAGMGKGLGELMKTVRTVGNTHIYQLVEACYRERERNVLFNDALNTFYLRLYGVRHMVKDHSDSEKGNPLPPHRLLYRLTARVLLYAPSHIQDSTYHSLCYTSRGALAGTYHHT